MALLRWFFSSLLRLLSMPMKLVGAYDLSGGVKNIRLMAGNAKMMIQLKGN
jgi:hypothetical protein